MFGPITLGSNDIERSRRFYDAVLGALGASEGTDDPRGRIIYSHGGSRLIVTKPLNSQPATAANGNTITLILDNPAMVDAWHRVGVAHGGTQIEDPPGIREYASGQVYNAYLRDPDGHKLCALHRLKQ